MNKEIEKEVINCSRCGLCMDVCPVYKYKKTESSVSRGKFLQLLGLIRGDLKYDKKIAYNLDLCLNCKKCKSACPSNIDAMKIFATVKSEHLSFIEKMSNTLFIFKLKMLGLKVFYKIKYPLGRIKKACEINFNEPKTAYFKGCATDATGMRLDLKNGKFSCCGLPFYTKGRIDLYEKCKKKNLDLIKKYNKVVFDCATCYDTVSNYEGVEKEKLFYFTDFFKNENLCFQKPVKVAFHKPCHMNMEKYEEIREILKNIENVQFIDYKGFDDCCGFGGDFFTRHIKTASFLSAQKIENILKVDPDIVLTSCPTCLWSLKFGIKYKKAKIKAFDVSEFLQSRIINQNRP